MAFLGQVGRMRLNRRCVVVDLPIGNWSPVGIHTESFWAQRCKDEIEDADMGSNMQRWDCRCKDGLEDA